MKDKTKINKKARSSFLLLAILGFTISAVSLVVFLRFASQVMINSGGIYFDEKVISSIHKSISPNIKNVMIVVSFLGSVTFYFLLAPFLIWYLIKNKHYIELLALLIAILGSYGLNATLKHYYERIRPEAYFLVEQGGFSFPSGHAMIAMSFYGMATYLVVRNKKWSIKKISIWILTIVFIALMGFSRIYLGVHWPTDVIAGFGAGFIWLYFCIVGVEVAHKRL